MKKLSLLFIVLQFYVMANAQIDLQDGLIAYYPFSGNPGDSSGNAFHGAAYDCDLIEDRLGKPNSAYFFNGTSSYIDIGNNPLLKRYNSSFSISAWIKVAGFSSDYLSAIVSNRKNTGEGSALAVGGLLRSPGYKTVNFSVSGGYSTSLAIGQTSLQTSQWHHLVVTFNFSGNFNNEVRLYLDGNLESVSYLNNVTDPTGAPTYIGFEPSLSVPADYHFYGAIDEIRMYNRAINQDEVQFLFNPIVSTNLDPIENEILISNNPDPGYLFIETSRPVYDLTMALYDVSGKLIYRKLFPVINGREILEIKNSSQGLYNLVIEYQGKSFCKKVVAGH